MKVSSQGIWWVCSLLVLWLVSAWGILAASAAGADRQLGVVVRFDDEHRPVIRPLAGDEVKLGPNELGLVVWTESHGDLRDVFRGEWKRPAGPIVETVPPSLVRGLGWGNQLTIPSSRQLTTQLDPLFLPSVVKSLSGSKPSWLISPANGGSLLFSRPVFRRFDRSSDSPPQISLSLTSAGQSAVLRFGAGETAIPFERLEGLPVTWRDGLPPGEYQWTETRGQRETGRFRVEDVAIRDAFLERMQAWEKRLGTPEDPLYALVFVESLMANQPHPYLSDAADYLERIPGFQQTPHLQWRHAALIATLSGTPEPLSPELLRDSTGIPGIDRARQQIGRGLWKDALATLDSLDKDSSPRSRGLADLYRGVVHAEWGLSQEDAAEFYFRKALVGLERASSSDRFRALNNYANFLLNRTQDRILDHAFQMAAGVRGLFVQAILSWDESRRHYEAAFELAASLDRSSQAAVQLNLANLHAVFGDLLATLDVAEATERQLAEAEQVALATANGHLDQAVRLTSPEDTLLAAATATLRAQLALRDGNFAACREAAAEARRFHLALGSLAGVEGMERLLGFQELRQQSSDVNPERGTALAHLELAQMLTEWLRARLPSERIGRTAAGFFARRSGVTEELVELLAESGRAEEALGFAELGKARGLQDLLLTGSPGGPLPDPVPLSQVLENWPAHICALEYFLTRDHAWVFVVSADHRVEAFPLTDPNGQSIASRELLTRVQRVLLTEFQQYGGRMRQRVLAGQGFDHRWQQELNDLYRILVPDGARQRLAEAKTLLIVPHHLLHYFPFAALVTELDDRPRQPLEMVQPRFLIDGPVQMVYAPSLATWQLLRRREDHPLTQVSAVAVPRLPGAAPLPGVQRELESLAKFFPKPPPQVVRAEKATKAAMLRLLEQPGLLLVGTHGQNDPDEPLASHLSLYPSANDDGRLTAGELFLQRVRTDLVLLSACYTGLADRSPLAGDDLFGLSRALLQAGTRTVVTGSWDVFEGTGPDLTHLFFRHLAAGRSAPEALASAQRDFLARLRASREPEPYLHPYFWAVYAVTGDDRTRFSPRE